MVFGPLSINSSSTKSNSDQQKKAMSGDGTTTTTTTTNEKGMIFSLLKRMNPGLCLCGESMGDLDIIEKDEIQRTEAILEGTLLQIFMDINNEEKENRGSSAVSTEYTPTLKISAYEKLHELSKSKANRVPLVYESKWEIIPFLAKGLHPSEECQLEGIDQQSDDLRRLACLTLINLSLPHQNKREMVHGPHSNILLGNVTRVISMMIPEATYLCCILLMNLSQRADAADRILTYSSFFHSCGESSSHDTTNVRATYKANTIDPRDWDTFPTSLHSTIPTHPRQRRSSSTEVMCLDDPNSFIRSLERLMRDKQPFLMSKAFSVEGEGIRWAVGLLRNLTLKDEHCAIISKTQIPSLVLGILERTPHQTIKWTSESTEDMTLAVLYNLAASPSSRETLNETGAGVVLRSIQTGPVGGASVREKVASILDHLLDPSPWKYKH